MRRAVVSFVLFLAVVVTAGAQAQTHRYDHVHLAAADPAKAVEWYIKNLGAVHGDAPDRVLIGRTIFAFIKRDGSPPSEGSAVDHIGWTTADTEAQVAELKAKDGVKISTEPRMVRHLKVALFDDPSGVRVEIVQNRMEEELRPH
jgi:catechol 2,3-dioxygenase-like lactoylglutathione lyase family enzyme